ncbi:unnamed protein product [Peronospora farinosa]|uniref:Dynein regulatory complex protein 10 n=1 Tax=Peronospora farinosa TaxID=134698 RepID=A0AAV0TNZ2_9STRA|nr:unnamed protein product [Peronospora farinosa]CAI5722694.1 unnamed protein product [Peronospora farinosa]
MMTLPPEEEMTSPPSSPTNSMALIVKDDDEPVTLNARDSDLELHLLQTFVAATSQQLVQSYRSLKHVSRVTHLIATMTESLMSRSGLVALVQLLFHQYMRLGHPLVQQVDEAMGKRVIDAVVSILMLSEQQPVHQSGILALEVDPDNNNKKKKKDTQVHEELSAVTKLSYEERFQALLLGQVPRMEQVLVQARLEALEEAARQDPQPVVMELKDFVPVDEVTRLKEESKEQLHEAAMEAARLRSQMMELTEEKQKLEQRLTDVFNYQESERGQRFQKMEEDLARTKLEASQKAYDFAKLELFVNELKRKKHKKRSKSHKGGDNESNTSESAPPSSVAEKRSDKGHEGKRSRRSSNAAA